MVIGREIGAGGDRCHQTPLLWDRDWVVEFDIEACSTISIMASDEGSAQALSGALDLALRRALAESADAKRGRAASGARQGHAARRRRVADPGQSVPALRVRSLGRRGIRPGVRFARYADDAVLHCKSRRQAEYVLDRIRERFQACNLELHPGKTRIVYCKDIDLGPKRDSDIQSTLLGDRSAPARRRTSTTVST